MNKFKKFLLIFVLITFNTWGLEVKSQENEDSPVIESSQVNLLTTQNPEIPEEELKLLVKPLTKQELQIEAQEWLLLLKSKVTEISNVEIAIQRQNRELEKTKESIKAINEAEKAISENEASKETTTTEEVEEALEKVQQEINDVNEEEENTQTDGELQEVIEEAKQDIEETEETEETEKTKSNQSNQTIIDENSDTKTDRVQENIDNIQVDDGISSQESEKVEQELEKSEETLKETEEEKTKIKQQLVENVTELQIERTALIERFNIVLNELELKGGNVEEYRQYIQAVSGVELDLTDTDSLGIRIVTWLKSEEGGLIWVLNILRFVGILLGCLFLGWLLNQFYNITHKKYLANQLDNQIEPILKRVIHLIIWTIVSIVTLSSVGINVTAIITSLGIGGLAFALAAQDTVANLFGGVILLAQGRIKVGDRIEVEGMKARVIEIGLRSTIIKELDYDYEVFVPNSKFTDNIISHIDSRPHYSIYQVLHLHYSTTSEQMELALELIKTIASKNEFIKGARPSFEKIDDYCFNLKFVYWIKKWLPTEKELFPNDLWKIYTVKSQMNLAIMQEFEKHKIKLALPLQIFHKGSEINGTGIFSVTNQKKQ